MIADYQLLIARFPKQKSTKIKIIKFLSQQAGLHKPVQKLRNFVRTPHKVSRPSKAFMKKVIREFYGVHRGPKGSTHGLGCWRRLILTHFDTFGSVFRLAAAREANSGNTMIATGTTKTRMTDTSTGRVRTAEMTEVGTIYTPKTPFRPTIIQICNRINGKK